MATSPIVVTEQGKIRGRILHHCRGGNYYSFQGIPYAKPPVGELRFKAPLPPESWEGIRDATKEGDWCYSRHIVFQTLCGSEDCLFLNVYTPELPQTNFTPKPVMVWIHGGGFYAGSGNSDVYGPDFLLPEDVIVVTINYRLGLLGFLSFNDPTLNMPGNAGLKDQVLALRWVQKNIAAFGGDPNNVTIFGESAGGASVHYLILSPMAKGLFHRAIAQSGTAFSTWAQGQTSAPMIVKILSLDTVDEKQIAQILQEMPVEKILEIQEKDPNVLVINNNKTRSVSPVVENFLNEDTFLPDTPMNLIKTGRYNKVPLMIGYNSREGMLMEIVARAYNGKFKIDPNFKNDVPHALNIPPGSELAKDIAQKIKRFYFGKETPSSSNMDAFYTLQTDTLFLNGIHTAIKVHNSTSPTPVYLYRISVETSLNILKKITGISTPGVCHGEELLYLFKTIATPNFHADSTEDRTIRRFAKLWTTFARYGDPNPKMVDPSIPVEWKPTKPGQHHFLDIGENLTVGINPETERLAFWEEIYCSDPTLSKL